MSNQKVTGFQVRSDKGTFEHKYDEPMYNRETKEFVDKMTYGHNDILAKHYTLKGGHIPH